MIHAKPFTVTKIAGKFLVEGVFEVNRARLQPEPYAKVERTKRAAEGLVERCNKQNAEDIADFYETRARRVEIAQAYIAARAARPAPAQMELF